MLSLTWGLGSIAAVLAFLLFGRGLMLKVDTGKLKKRSVFAANQVTYPKKT